MLSELFQFKFFEYLLMVLHIQLIDLGYMKLVILAKYIICSAITSSRLIQKFQQYTFMRKRLALLSEDKKLKTAVFVDFLPQSFLFQGLFILAMY